VADFVGERKALTIIGYALAQDNSESVGGR